MKRLKGIKSSKTARALYAFKSAVKILPEVITGKDLDVENILQKLAGKNIEKFINEVGAYKGSVLKAAQILSSYGEYYFSEDINKTLRKVLSHSQFLDANVLLEQVPVEVRRKLTIDETPLAAASIGQVHRATITETGEQVVLKIQYPGIRKAISLDMKILKGLVSLLKILPKNIDMSQIYKEVQRVLEYEMDYVTELNTQSQFARIFKDQNDFYIPKVYPNLSTNTVLVSEFIDAKPLSLIDISLLSQKDRDRIGSQVMYLYFYEIFNSNYIQTDCHGGNFLIREVEGDFELVLIDFGSCLKFQDEILEEYKNLLRGIFLKDRELFIKTFKNILDKSNDNYHVDEDMIWDYCSLAASPMDSNNYDWGETNLPDLILEKSKDLISGLDIQRPPHHFIFLDRKLLGTFSILRKLKSKVDMKTLANDFLT